MMQMIEHVVLALTPVERWSAARQLESGSDSGQWVTLGAAFVLLVLVALLVWVSHRHSTQNRSGVRKVFTENSLRQGLSARERQILLAIAMRSGAQHPQAVFAAADVFDRGAAKLLAECACTRTAPENEHLRAEVACLRVKLGFAALVAAGSRAVSEHPSTRDIPIGKRVDLADPGETVRIRAAVVRNDDLELAVELQVPVEPIERQAGAPWRARCCRGMSVWEFDTATVDSAGTRLILNHSDNIRVVDRRRFPRLEVAAPALVAPLPLVRVGSAAAESPAGGFAAAKLLEQSDLYDYAPQFTSGLVAEFAGPGLRIETRLEAEPGERVLVLFRLPGGSGAGGPGKEYAIAGVGQVKRREGAEGKASLCIELTGLDDAQIDELMDALDAVAPTGDDPAGSIGMKTRASHSATAAAK